MSKPLKVFSEYQPMGDQPQALEELTQRFKDGEEHSVLLGVTGSGKTFTMAKLIENLNRPALVLSHNKTLAAQLYQEFKAFFPENAVEYFVSYYDYYQPEAYVAASDTFIEKDASINAEIEKLRHKATASLFMRKDVIIVASVSCIYGLGTPENYYGMMVKLMKGEKIDQREVLKKLVEIQYTRNNMSLDRGQFRVRGDVLEVFPPYEERVIRASWFGDEIEDLAYVDPLTGKVEEPAESIPVFPKSHYVASQTAMLRAMEDVRKELAGHMDFLYKKERFLEAQRLDQRTRFDLEMIQELGYCSGIENYSRHLEGRAAETPPCTLLDFFPEDGLILIDESHVTLPQVRGMFKGDRSRKNTLVEHGFRLPSAVDNRPLTFEEFLARTKQRLYVSATPGPWELEQTGGEVTEQVVRPTGLMDPPIEIRPIEGQVDDLLEAIRQKVEVSQRTLVTTLTKKMAEELSRYLNDVGVKTEYLHSDIDSIERTQILVDLRKGLFDVLVGVNLLREGLDLPEVGLVAILDADKEGFLRSEGSLIQTMGRAARNVDGKCILYADRITNSMARAMEEVNRRREIQEIYNKEHGITPTTIVKNIRDPLIGVADWDYRGVPMLAEEKAPYGSEQRDPKVLAAEIAELEGQMLKAAGDMEFEKAAQFRDQVRALRDGLILTTAGGDKDEEGMPKPWRPGQRKSSGPKKKKSSIPKRFKKRQRPK